jgi:hypothetical protein
VSRGKVSKSMCKKKSSRRRRRRRRWKCQLHPPSPPCTREHQAQAQAQPQVRPCPPSFAAPHACSTSKSCSGLLVHMHSMGCRTRMMQSVMKGRRGCV